MNSTSSRLYNTKRNLIASYVSMITQMLFQFISRWAILRSLGQEYLGVSSLFTSILQVLNMAELGFSASIVYSMYKPLAENDTETVCALLSYYQKIYRIVGLVVFSCGILITPFLQTIIKGEIPGNLNLHIVFLLYLTNTGISYFLFAHKTALLNAVQRLDLTKIVTTIVNLLQYILQIASVLLFKNYYLYTLFMIFGTASINIGNAIVSKKYFPHYSPYGVLDKGIRYDISSKVKGLFICHVSGVTYTTFDSIILSAFIGLSSVAVYNNYIAIFNAVSSIVAVVRASMQASVGNSVAIESKDKNYRDMLQWQFLFSVIATWCGTCMLCLYQPFMTFWMGKDLLLPFIDVILLCVWFVVSIVQHAHYLYLSGNGLWEKLQWPYIFSTVFNLIMNIVLGKLYGITGIILSSLLAVLIFSNFWQCIIIFREYYNISSKYYIYRQIKYFLVASIVAILTYFVCRIIPLAGLAELIVKAIVCMIVPTSLLILIYRKTTDFNITKQLVFKTIKGKRKGE